MSELKITQQALEDRQVLLTIEVPEERVEPALKDAARKAAKRYRFPGFRPGKAPYHVVVGMVGKEALMEDVADAIGQEIFGEALQAADITPVAAANLVNITFDPLTYQIEVPLAPEVDAGDYRSLRLAYEAPTEEAIKEAVDKELDQMREQQRTWIPVERAIAYGDLVTISIHVKVDDETVLENEDWDFVPDTEDYTLAPDFDAAFIDMQLGESKTFTASFPEDSDSPWAGKEGQFDVSVKGIKSQELPELNDEFAQEIGEYETFDALYQEVYEHIKGHMVDDAEGNYRKELMDKLLEGATIQYPPAILDQEVEAIVSEQENMFKSYGFESTAELLRLQGKTEEEYHTEMRPVAKIRLEQRLVLDAIVEAEAFPINDYELAQFLTEALGPDNEQLDDYLQLLAKDELYRLFIRSLVARDRASDLLLALAKGEDVPAPGEHLEMEIPPEPEPEPEPVEAVEEVPTGAEPEAELAPAEDGDKIPDDVIAEADLVESEAASQPAAGDAGTLEDPTDSED